MGDRPQSALTPADRLLNVLVVDDERAIRDGLSVLLSQRRSSVRTAFDLRSAVGAVVDVKPDAILLDVRLAGENGLHLVTLLREMTLEIPCVVYTAHAGPYDGFRAHELGVAGLIEKPSSPDVVAGALRRAASRSPSHGFSAAVADFRIAGPVRDRIAAAICRLVASESDLRTLGAWARKIGVAEGTFKGWCRICEIQPGEVLRFGRLLRAVTRQASVGAPWADSLELLDARTAHAWFERAFGSADHCIGLPQTAAEFLQTQRLISDKRLIQRVTSLLEIR